MRLRSGRDEFLRDSGRSLLALNQSNSNNISSTLTSSATHLQNESDHVPMLDSHISKNKDSNLGDEIDSNVDAYQIDNKNKNAKTNNGNV